LFDTFVRLLRVHRFLRPDAISWSSDDREKRCRNIGRLHYQRFRGHGPNRNSRYRVNRGTVQLARELGAEVFDFPWQDDFAQARNAAVRALTTDWVLVMDDDEELDAGFRAGNS
jgi:hypothetical protein